MLFLSAIFQLTLGAAIDSDALMSMMMMNEVSDGTNSMLPLMMMDDSSDDILSKLMVMHPAIFGGSADQQSQRNSM